MKFFITLCFLLSFLIIAKGQTSSSVEKIFTATKKVNDHSLAGHLKQDANQIISALAEDAIILPPGGSQPIKGLENIKQYYLDGFQQGASLEITTDNISYQVIDDAHANEVGKYSILYQAKDSDEPIVINGFMMIAWEKNKQGEWKIKYDMWH